MNIVAAADRSDDDKALDAGRQPAEMLAFFGISPGMNVADLAAGFGYTTELFARAVGPNGKVYGQINFPVIAQWFEAHDAERSGLFEANHETKKGELNGSNHDRKAPLLTNSFDDMVRDEANKKANFFMKKRTENEEGEK